MKTPDLILSADWHIRETTPECRTDDFIKAMEKKIDFILDLFPETPIIIAGDLFHRWYLDRNERLIPGRLAWLIKKLSKRTIYTVPGNHDLPEHSVDQQDKSAYEVLVNAKAVTDISKENASFSLYEVFGFPWGKEVGAAPSIKNRKKRIAATHQYVYKARPPFPNCPGRKGRVVIDENPGWDLIVSGDNHQSFYNEKNGRLLVNPGSIMRTTADQEDFQPRVALWYAEDNSIEWVDLPIESGVVSREHLERKEAREARVSSYVERLRTDIEAKLQFRDNMKTFLAENPVREEISNLIWESMK